MNIRRHLIAGVASAACLLTAALPAAAQEPSIAGKWAVNWGEKRCSLVRQEAGPGGQSLVAWIYLGGHKPELFIVNPAWENAPVRTGEEVEIVLAPSGHRMKGIAAPGRISADGARLVRVRSLGEDFFSRLGESTELSIYDGRDRIAAISFTEAKAAVAALNTCNDDLLRSWGVDPHHSAVLQRHPVPRAPISSWFGPYDYPSVAFERRSRGKVVMRFTIDTEGKVVDCVPVVSAGDRALDEGTCKLLKARGRYEPALGPTGEPVIFKDILTISWAIQ